MGGGGRGLHHDVIFTYCVRKVKAALVMLEGRLSPLQISRHSFLLMTSTRPPFETTNRKSSNKSRGCFAMIGIRLTGVPKKKTRNKNKNPER